jgi:hypothetical protein
VGENTLVRIGQLANAHLYLYSEVHGFSGSNRHIGVLSSMKFEDVIRELTPAGQSYPRTYDEMRRFIEIAAGRYPGEVIPFECSDVTSVYFNAP